MCREELSKTNSDAPRHQPKLVRWFQQRCEEYDRENDSAVTKMIRWSSVLLFAMVARAQVTVQHAIPPLAEIRIDAGDVKQSVVPRTIFGTFLEPIGNSTYNGLWAEILENPSLEEGLWSGAKVEQMLRERPELRRASELALPLPWEPLDEAQGNRYERRIGDAANSFQSLRVFAVPGQPTGIRQRVYLPVHRTLEYNGSFYARHVSGDSTLAVSIRLRDSKEPLASQQIEVSDSSWKKYTFTLKLPDGRIHRLDPADFVVQLAGNEWVDLDQLSLMPADAIDGLDPDAVRLAREMHSPLVRFGGNFTSAYHWKDGIGPRDKRVSMMNNSWGIPEYNTFGTDEFLQFCRLIDAQPQFALNLGGGTPQEAADWVRYIEQHWDKHSGLLWELGNELWGNWNLAYPTKEELAARTWAFSKAVRSADPQARIIATGADPEVFKEWNGIQVTNPPGTFDFLSTHFVVGVSDVQLHRATPDFIASAAFAMPVELERRLRDAQQQIDTTPGYHNSAHIAFTEWLFIGDTHRAPNYTNVGGALITGGFLDMLLRNADIVPVSDMTGIMEFAGIWKKRSQVFATPAYYVFKMFAGADIAKVVSSTTQAGDYSVSHGVDRLPEIASVPYLDVVAALSEDGRKLTLFCVNRSVTTDIPAKLNIAGFSAAETAKVQVLSSAALTDANDEIDPSAVLPVESTERLGSRGWSHTFPHASVTVLSIDRK